MLAYSSGPFSFKATASETTDSVTWPIQYSNVVAPDPNLQIENTKGYMLTVKYQAGNATAKAGYESLTISAPSNVNLNVQDYYGLMLPSPSVNATGEQFFSLYWVGGDYQLTPKFDLSAAFYNIDTYNAPEIGKDYWAAAYSLLTDYSFTRSFDSYIGVMLMEFSGRGLDKHAPIDAFPSNGMYGVGIRYRF
jgi:predicted porin